MNALANNVRKYASALILPLSFVSRAGASSQDAMVDPGTVGSTEVLSVTGGLMLVIAAILLAGYLYSRMKGPRIGGNNVINIIASQALGPKERIVLVDIADTQLAIGLTSSNVQTLHVFDKPVVNAIEATAHTNFADRLKDALRSVRK